MPQPSDPSPRELLADTAWVEGLARGLLADRGEVEDSVQQTWLAALGGRPRDPDRRRAWLAGILRNVVRRQARAEGRRRRHEAAAARDALAASGGAPARTVPSTVDLVARAELQRHLAAAVLGLDEPFRTTVLLRYFGGLSSRRIAAREGIPAATVRTRLHRAHARLRRQLDGGSRRWTSALLALAAPAHRLPLGGLVMTTKTQLAGAAVVLAILGVAGWWIAGMAPLPSPAGGDRLLAASAPEVSDAPIWHAAGAEPLVLLPGDDGELRSTAAPPAPGDATGAESPWPGDPVRFTGRVVDDVGAPVEDAEVVFVPNLHNLAALKTSLREELRRRPEDRLARARTDAQGRYTLDARHLALAFGELPHARYRNDLVFPEIVVQASGRGRVARVLRGWDGGDRELDDIVLGPGGSVHGRVVDEQGFPLAGVEVEERLWLLSESAERSDDVEQKGHASDFLSTRTGADGRFVLTGTTEGSGWLQLNLPGRLETEIERFDLPTEGVLDLGDVVLRAGGTLAGRVVDARGQPVEGAWVGPGRGDTSYYDMGSDTILLEVRSLARWPNAVQTSASGAFEVSGLPESSLTLWVDAPGFEPARLAGVTRGGPDVVLEVVPQATLVVRVLDDETGASVQGAVVSAWRPTGIAVEPDIALVVTGPSADAAGTAQGGVGRHVVERPGLLRTRLFVTAPGYADAVTEALGVGAPHSAEQVVRLVGASQLAGRVLDPEGDPVAGARLTLAPQAEERPSEGAQASARRTVRTATRPVPGALAAATRQVGTGADGRFLFDGLGAGPWELDVLARGFVSGPGGYRYEVGTAQRRELEVILLEAGAVHGTIYNVDGSPRPGDGVPMWLREQDGSIGRRFFSSMADEQGRFVEPCLPPGSYHIQCDPGGLVDFEVAAGRTTEVEVRLRARPRIAGRTYAAHTGEPVAGVMLRLTSWSMRDGVRIRGYGNSVQSHEDGSFALEPGWPGSYELLAWTRSGAPAPPVPVTLAWGDELHVDVTFARGRVEGTVVGPEGEPVAEGWVLLRSDTMASRRVDTGDSGAFAIELIAPGRYGLAFGAQGLVSLEDVYVEVADDAPVEGLVLPLGQGSHLAGQVRLRNGAPVADGTYVELLLDGEWYSRVETGAGGFTFGTVRPGRYELVVGNTAQAKYFENDAWILWREPVTLVAGQERALEILLER